MNNRELVAYAVDVDTGEITWEMYSKPWENEQKVAEG